jgi:hypothetical protein
MAKILWRKRKKKPTSLFKLHQAPITSRNSPWLQEENPAWRQVLSMPESCKTANAEPDEHLKHHNMMWSQSHGIPRGTLLLENSDPVRNEELEIQSCLWE